MKKLEAAIRDAESAKSDEHASQREQIRINVLLEKLHREHSWQGIQRWEAHFYTKALHEAAADARQSLFELAKEALQEAIYWANKYPNNKDIDRAREKAEKELKNPKTTHERIDQVKDELISAIREEEKIHLSEDIRKELKSLEEAILVAEKYPESDGIKEALKEAKKVRDAVKEGDVSLETKKEISEAKDKLIRELAYALAPATDEDVRALRAKLKEAETYEAKANRAPIIKKMLDDAMTNGYAVLGDPSKREVKYNYTEAIKRIDDVIQAIQNLPDLELVKKLEALIEEAETLRANKDLSFVSKAKLYEALSEANYVKADHLSTDEDYILAYNKLEVAISSVEEANPDLPATDRDRELLKKAIEAAEEMLKREGLSKKDGEILNAEIAKGEAMLEKEGATKVEMQRTTEAIYAAVDNAKPANHLPATQEQIDRLNELLKEANTQRERPGISFEDLKTLDYAIEKGQQLIDHEAPKRAEYDEAIRILEEALEKTAPMNPIEDPSKLATAEDKYLLEAKMRELSGQRIHVVASEVERIDRANRDANTVLLDPRATKSQVKKQIDYLDKMLQSLEKKATPEQIQEMRDLAKRAAIQLKRLNPVEAKKLNDEYQMMKTLLEGYDAKQLDISEKTANERIYKLQMALNDTIKQATDEEKEKLKDKIKELERDKENLSPEDKKELEDLLEKGKELADDLLANDIDVEDMMNQLEKWEEKTKLATSKQELKEAIAKAKEAMKNNPKVNKEKLDQAIKYAEQVLAKSDANQATINDAAQGLEKAMQEFNESVAEKEAADEAKRDLLSKINEAEAKKTEQISQASKDRLTKAIEDGKRVYNDHETIESVVRDAIKDLEVAMEQVEPLASEAQSEALKSKMEQANAILKDKKEVLSPMQYEELQRAVHHAAAEIQKLEKLEKDIVEATNRIDTVIQQLVYLAKDSHFDILKRKINSLQIIRDLYEELDPAALELQPVLNEARAVLAKKDLPERASEAEVMGQVTIIDEWLEKYKDALDKRWKEEKELLDRYITHINDVILKDDFTWGNKDQDEQRVRDAKTEAEKLKARAEGDEKDKVKLDELIEQNEKLSKIINEVDRMTKANYDELLSKKNDIEAGYNNAVDNGQYEKAEEIRPLLDKVNAELAKVEDPHANPFKWPGMDRLKYQALLKEIEEAELN